MPRRNPRRPSVSLAALAALLAVAPAARAAIVVTSQSHLLTTSATINDVSDADTATGSTVGDVDAQATSTIPGAGAASMLDLAYNGPRITGRLSGSSNTTPQSPSPALQVSVNAEGEFALSFTVAEPTPFLLEGNVSWQTRSAGNPAFADISLREDGTRIGGGTTGPGGNPIGGGALVVGSGVLQPGRTYTLSGEVRAPLGTGTFTLSQFTDAVAEFTFTVPEPSAAGCALAFGAMFGLRRRR